MIENRALKLISLEKYLIGDKGNTGLNEDSGTRHGTWGTRIAFSPLSDTRHPLQIDHGTLKSHQAYAWLQKPQHSSL